MNIGKAITALERKRKRLLEQQQSIERQIAVIDQTIEGYKFLGNPEARMPLPKSLNGLGLQDAVRAVFRNVYPHALFAKDVRNALMYAGLLKSTPKNLLIAVHTVISRIADELEEVTQAEGKTAYRWKPEK